VKMVDSEELRLSSMCSLSSSKEFNCDCVCEESEESGESPFTWPNPSVVVGIVTWGKDEIGADELAIAFAVAVVSIRGRCACGRRTALHANQ